MGHHLGSLVHRLIKLLSCLLLAGTIFAPQSRADELEQRDYLDVQRARRGAGSGTAGEQTVRDGRGQNASHR